MLGILAKRSQQESAMEMKSPASGHNKITAGQLANLLDSRKAAQNDQEVKELAKLYGVDYEVVESLGRFVTSPSVESKSVMGPEGESVLTVRLSFCRIFFSTSVLLMSVWLASELHGWPLRYRLSALLLVIVSLSSRC